MVLCHKRTNNFNTYLIRRVAETFRLKQVLSVILDNAKHRLSSAEKTYKKMKNLLTDYNMSSYVISPSQKTKKDIFYIRRHEETRRIWRAINRSQGKSYVQGISKVDINVDGE